MDRKKLRMLALKHSLRNASDYGKAAFGNVMGKVIAEYPECKKDMKSCSSSVSEVIAEVNSMSREDIAKSMESFEYSVKEEKSSLEKIRDKVPGAKPGKVVTRLPPEPNAAALHIGHAKAMWLDRIVADLFKGKCILRWDDTNPEKESAENVEELKKDLGWMGIRWDSETYASDSMELFYKLCLKLLRDGNGYVCTCPNEEIRQGREKKTACRCRSRKPAENAKLWKSMLAGEIGPGKAVVRLKGSMKSQNTAMRDPSLFRIIDTKATPHYRQGSRYTVWPLYDFESAVMDSPSTIGITHPIRSKEYELRDEVYFRLIDMLRLKKPNLITISRLSIPGYPVSKRLIRPLVEDGKVWGWDDPRLVTIKGLARRGIQPQAIKEFVLQFGISTSESSPDLEKLFAENRKIIDPSSQRRMFVPNPYRIKISGADSRVLKLKNHPENDLGTREISVSDEVYIPKADMESINESETFRLKDLFNVKMEKGHFFYFGNDGMKDAKKIQWVPLGSVKCKVIVPGRLFGDDDSLLPGSIRTEEGLCEPSCMELAEGEVVQFERYGFVRIDRIDAQEKSITAIFCHK